MEEPLENAVGSRVDAWLRDADTNDGVLNLGSKDVTDQELEELANGLSARNITLMDLNLSSNSLTSAGPGLLTLLHPSLVNLILGSNAFGLSMDHVLPCIQNMINLEDLDLSDMGMSEDTTAKALAAALNGKLAMKKLNLWGNEFGVAMDHVLPSIQTMSNLEILYLGDMGMSEVSTAKALAAALKGKQAMRELGLRGNKIGLSMDHVFPSIKTMNNLEDLDLGDMGMS